MRLTTPGNGPAKPAADSADSRRGEPSDGELVGRCCAGDHEAWRQLYTRHFGAVYRFVSALGVPADERDDAAQEVFISVYRSLPSFRGEAQLSTWIYRIAHRQAMRLSRRRRVRDVMKSMLMREAPPPLSHNPVERSSDIEFLDRLLARLAPKKRAALVLFEIEGLPVEEIARVVGCPVNTVWSRLHHARAELTRFAKLAERNDLRRNKDVGDISEQLRRKRDGGGEV